MFLQLGNPGIRGQECFRCLGSRVFVCEVLRIDFDADAFLLVGNLFEGFLWGREHRIRDEQWIERSLSMDAIHVEQKSYEMPPREGISIAHFLTVADVERSARYYEKVFGARILSLGDGNAPAYLQLANIWMILNVGGGPTPDKPTVTLSVPDPKHINSFMNFRVADIQACYALWKSRGAEFITEPIPKYGEMRCYMRDPDGYIIEVGQSTELKYG